LDRYKRDLDDRRGDSATERLEGEPAKTRRVVEMREDAHGLLKQMIGTEGASGPTKR
jgi:hypothetical protein